MPHPTPVDRPGLVVGLLPVDATTVIAAVVAAMLLLIMGFFIVVAFARWIPWISDEFGPTGEQSAIESADTPDSSGDSASTAIQESDVDTSDSGTESVEGS